MLKFIKMIGLLICGLLINLPAWGCPACVVSRGESKGLSDFWVLAFMGVLPLFIALLVGIFIVKWSRHENA